jgi:hypothetical protein
LIDIAPENSQEADQDMVPKKTARDDMKFRDALITDADLSKGPLRHRFA